MKFLSASFIVASGAAIIVSSQHSAAAIMKIGMQYDTAIARTGITIGSWVIVGGILGWAFSLYTNRNDSSAQSRSERGSP